MMIPILLGVSLVVFVIMRMVPGDVATMILMGPTGDVGARQEDIAALRAKLGLDRPLAVQYLSWIGGLLTLDAGESLWSGRPIFEEVLERLPLTLELAALASAISVVIALTTGILSAVRQDTWIDYVFRAVSIAGLSVPNFWLGTLVILIQSRYFCWSPPLGYTAFLDEPLTNLQQMLWPAAEMRRRLVHDMERKALLGFGRLISHWRMNILGHWPEVRNYKIHPSLYNDQRFQDVWLAKR
jgi:peptide/nickel transport system permease protein